MNEEATACGMRRTKARRVRRRNGITRACAALSIALGLALAQSHAAETLHRVDDAASSPVKAHARGRNGVSEATPTPHAPQNHFEITAHIVAAGASKPSSSACFHMDATIGEPVAGTSTSAHYILKGGFMAPRSTVRDEIFSNPFETCTP